MSNDMKACPFCGNGETNVFSHFALEFGSRTEIRKRQCTLCGAEAPEEFWNHRPAVKDSLTPAPACQFPACEDGTHPCAKHTPKACLRCKSSVTIWKGWELCDTCGFRHHESGLWPDGAAPTTEKGGGT